MEYVFAHIVRSHIVRSRFGRSRVLLDVTVVTPSNYFNFTPLLASCSVGTLEFRAAVEPVRRRFCIFVCQDDDIMT